jgi:pimeloyl-ACP methyl ester carboxylesterase
MQEYLAANGDWDVLRFSYASTRGEIEEHAEALARVISSLEGVTDVDFVAHSMGNVVIRRYLAAHGADEHVADSHPRIGRIVMLAPPNQGSALARTMQDDPLFRTVLGASGRQLGGGWADLEKTLATPKEFGVVAGSVSGNALLEGDDDLVVRVEETRLAGAADFAVAPVAHTYIMDDSAVQQMTLRFLKDGHLRSEEERQPIH